MQVTDDLPSRYTIESRLGKGEFGEVYVVFDSLVNRQLALKIVSIETAMAQETLSREFQSLSQLQHPNLVKVIDFGMLSAGRPYFTMEYIKGLNLRAFLAKESNLLFIPAIIRQTLSALTYLNGNGVSHGDIKPENIMVIADDKGDVTVKLLDFGLAYNAGTQHKLISGTPQFLAPEILTGGTHSPSADLYALGMSLIECILCEEAPGSNGNPPDDRQNTHAALKARFLRVGLVSPLLLSSFILDLCRSDPTERYKDAKVAFQKYELLSNQAGLQHEIQLDDIFVGRNREIADINSFLENEQAAERALILVGDPGVGKKTLVRKAVQAAQLKRHVIVDLTTSSSSYFSLSQFSDLVCSHLSASQKRLFTSRSGGTPHEAPISAKANLRADANRSVVVYDHMMQALHEISREQPLLFIISDLDRYGEDFLRFVSQLIKQIVFLGSQIRILITFNSNPRFPKRTSDLIHGIIASPASVALRIEPFDDTALLSLLKELFGRELIPHKDRQTLLSSTRGLPILIKDLIRHLMSSGTIYYNDGEWILDRRTFTTKHIPSDVKNALAFALDGISEDEMRMLRLLTIYGTAVSPGDLECMASHFIRNPGNALRCLAGRMITRTNEDGSVYLSHPLYAQVIQKHMRSATSRSINKLIAEFLISRGLSDSYRIAQHCIAAEIIDEAIKYALDAVNQLFSKYMLYDSLRLLLDLKGLLLRSGNDSKLPAVLDKLAAVEYQTGRPEEAIEDYYWLLAWSEDRIQEVQILKQIALVFHDILGNNEKAGATLKDALNRTKRIGDSALMAEVYYALAGTDDDKKSHYLEKAAELCKESNVNLYLMSLARLAYRYRISGKSERASELQAIIHKGLNNTGLEARKEILQHLSLMFFYEGDYADAKVQIEKKIEIERVQDDSYNMIRSLLILGGIHFTEGHYYEMIATLNDVYNLTRRFSVYPESLTALSNLSLAYRNLADYGHSLRVINQANRMIREENIDEVGSFFFVKPTELFAILGRATQRQFFAYAKTTLREATKKKNLIGLGHYHMCFANYHMNHLRLKNAILAADKALASFGRAEDRDDMVLALTQRAIVGVLRAEFKEAAAALEQATDIYDKIHCEYLRPFLLLAKGMLARSTNAEDARSVLTEALRTSKRIGTREITWQIQRELALFYQGRGEPNKALAHYKDAVETIKEITETIDDERLKISYLEVPFRKRVFDEIKEIKKQLREST